MMFIRSVLIATMLPFLAQSLPMNPPNDREIKEFVDRCYYEVGVKSWAANPAHECNEMEMNVDLNSIDYHGEYKPVFASLRKVMIAQEYGRVIREQQHEMQVTMQCAYHMKMPYLYTESTYVPRECETLWYGESRMQHNKSEAANEANKQARRLAKYMAELNWIPNSPEAAEDKKVALECYHDTKKNCPAKTMCMFESCLGITWGNSMVNAKRTQMRKKYYKQFKAIRPAALPEPEYINATGPFVVEEMVALAEVDHEMVAENKQDYYDFFECFYKEHFLLIDECKGLRFKRPEKITTLRQAHLVSYWTEIVQYVMYYPSEMATVKAAVEKKHAAEAAVLAQLAEQKRKEAEAEQKWSHELQVARQRLEGHIQHINAQFMRYWSHIMQ